MHSDATRVTFPLRVLFIQPGGIEQVMNPGPSTYDKWEHLPCCQQMMMTLGWHGVRWFFHHVTLRVNCAKLIGGFYSPGCDQIDQNFQVSGMIISDTGLIYSTHMTTWSVSVTCLYICTYCEASCALSNLKNCPKIQINITLTIVLPFEV